MRLALPLSALALAPFPACANPQFAIAQSDAATIEAPEDLLASQVRAAFARRDRDLLFAHVKWDRVRDVHRQTFSEFVTLLVEQGVSAVTVEPVTDGFPPFEHEGITYRKNGEPLGRLAISLVVERPTVVEYLYLPYGIENGMAVILMDAPASDEAGE